MIATGNHNFEKFAALCNTLSGEPRRLRRSGRLRAAPTGAVETGGLAGRQIGDPYVAPSIDNAVIYLTRAIILRCAGNRCISH